MLCNIGCGRCAPGRKVSCGRHTAKILREVNAGSRVSSSASHGFQRSGTQIHSLSSLHCIPAMLSAHGAQGGHAMSTTLSVDIGERKATAAKVARLCCRHHAHYACARSRPSRTARPSLILQFEVPHDSCRIGGTAQHASGTAHVGEFDNVCWMCDVLKTRFTADRLAHCRLGSARKLYNLKFRSVRSRATQRSQIETRHNMCR